MTVEVAECFDGLGGLEVAQTKGAREEAFPGEAHSEGAEADQQQAAGSTLAQLREAIAAMSEDKNPTTPVDVSMIICQCWEEDKAATLQALVGALETGEEGDSWCVAKAWSYARVPPAKELLESVGFVPRVRLWESMARRVLRAVVVEGADETVKNEVLELLPLLDTRDGPADVLDLLDHRIKQFKEPHTMQKVFPAAIGVYMESECPKQLQLSALGFSSTDSFCKYGHTFEEGVWKALESKDPRFLREFGWEEGEEVSFQRDQDVGDPEQLKELLDQQNDRHVFLWESKLATSVLEGEEFANLSSCKIDLIHVYKGSVHIVEVKAAEKMARKAHGQVAVYFTVCLQYLMDIRFFARRDIDVRVGVLHKDRDGGGEVYTVVLTDVASMEAHIRPILRELADKEGRFWKQDTPMRPSEKCRECLYQTSCRKRAEGTPLSLAFTHQTRLDDIEAIGKIAGCESENDPDGLRKIGKEWKADERQRGRLARRLRCPPSEELPMLLEGERREWAWKAKGTTLLCAQRPTYELFISLWDAGEIFGACTQLLKNGKEVQGFASQFANRKEFTEALKEILHEHRGALQVYADSQWKLSQTILQDNQERRGLVTRSAEGLDPALRALAEPDSVDESRGAELLTTRNARTKGPFQGPGSRTGTVKKWLDERGFGYIAPADGSPDVFVHHSAFDGVGLMEREQVTYDLEPDPKKPAEFRARNVSGRGMKDDFISLLRTRKEVVSNATHPDRQSLAEHLSIMPFLPPVVVSPREVVRELFAFGVNTTTDACWGKLLGDSDITYHSRNELYGVPAKLLEMLHRNLCTEVMALQRIRKLAEEGRAGSLLGQAREWPLPMLLGHEQNDSLVRKLVAMDIAFAKQRFMLHSPTILFEVAGPGPDGRLRLVPLDGGELGPTNDRAGSWVMELNGGCVPPIGPALDGLRGNTFDSPVFGKVLSALGRPIALGDFVLEQDHSPPAPDGIHELREGDLKCLRRPLFRIEGSPQCAFAIWAVSEVEPDSLLAPGAIVRLTQRKWTDMRSDLVIPSCEGIRSLHDINRVQPRGIPLPRRIEGGLMSLAQRRVLERCQMKKLSVVVGGPGVGKTRAILATILVMLRQSDSQLKVLLTAEAVDVRQQLLRRFMELLESDRTGLAQATVVVNKAGRRSVNVNSAMRWADDDPPGLSVTVAGIDSLKGDDRYDLVVVDEASQILTANGVCYFRHVGPRGRIIFSGDPIQAQPFKLPHWGEDNLKQSILFALLRDKNGDPLESRYDVATSTLDPSFITRLVTCFRSHPDVSLLAQELYGKPEDSGEPIAVPPRFRLRLTERSPECANDLAKWITSRDRGLGGLAAIEVDVPTAEMWNMEKYQERQLRVLEGTLPTLCQSFLREEQPPTVFVIGEDTKVPGFKERIRTAVGERAAERVTFARAEKAQGGERDIVVVCTGVPFESDGTFRMEIDVSRIHVMCSRARCLQLLVMPTDFYPHLKLVDKDESRRGFTHLRRHVELSSLRCRFTEDFRVQPVDAGQDECLSCSADFDSPAHHFSRGREPRVGWAKTGTVHMWDGRGFGFISPNDGSDSVFVHLSAFDGLGLRKGQQVSYDAVPDLRQPGKLKALHVWGSGVIKQAAPQGGTGSTCAMTLGEATITVTGKHQRRPIRSFNVVDFTPEIRSGIRAQRFTAPTPFQAVALSFLLSGLDLIGIAAAGSGKTLSFILAGIVHVNQQDGVRYGQGPIAIILAPTRELACHEKEIQRFCDPHRVRSVALDEAHQNTLSKGFEFVVATPGRLYDLLHELNDSLQQIINLRRCTYLVLDDADRMLDMGFEPQLRAILRGMRPQTASKRQICLFSATLPHSLGQLARDFLSPNHVTIHVA
eukprot:Hpha_TRINITY_DN16436_c0_g14::TRINITY_DN16436_c0_g14_i1::g.164126::m.164126